MSKLDTILNVKDVLEDEGHDELADEFTSSFGITRKQQLYGTAKTLWFWFVVSGTTFIIAAGVATSAMEGEYIGALFAMMAGAIVYGILAFASVVADKSRELIEE